MHKNRLCELCTVIKLNMSINFSMLIAVSKVGEQDLLLNYELLKSYLVHVVTSKGVPVLSDHKARSN